MAHPTVDTRAAVLEFSLSIRAGIATVWRVLTEEADAWWIPDMRCVPGDSVVSLDARAGGLLKEENSAGGSLLWYTVLAVEPERSLNLAGHMAPPFGGPQGNYLLLRLEAEGEGTRLHVTNSMHGVVDAASLPTIQGGWEHLFTTGLQARAEERAQERAQERTEGA